MKWDSRSFMWKAISAHLTVIAMPLKLCFFLIREKKIVLTHCLQNQFILIKYYLPVYF